MDSLIVTATIDPELLEENKSLKEHNSNFTGKLTYMGSEMEELKSSEKNIVLQSKNSRK